MALVAIAGAGAITLDVSQPLDVLPAGYFVVRGVLRVLARLRRFAPTSIIGAGSKQRHFGCTARSVGRTGPRDAVRGAGP